MAAYNSTSLPFHPYTMKANQVYALIAVPSSIQAGGPLTFSNTYGGTYNTLSDLSYVNGGFLKSSSDVQITVTKLNFKQLNSPFQSYKSLIYRDKPSYYWSLDEVSGLIAVDQIGGANGTISGGVTLNQSGAVGKGMLFNGTTGQIVTTANLPVVLTIEAWIKTTAAVNQAILSNYHVANGIWVGLDNLGRAQSFGANGRAGVKSINDGQWHHVVFLYKESRVEIYIDGLVDVNGLETRSVSSSGPLIGKDSSSLMGAPVYWNGTIDEIAIYPYALTPQQIQSHYFAKNVQVGSYAAMIVADKPSNYWQLDEEAGLTAVDIVGGKNGTISGGVTLNQVGAVNRSMTFDGVDDKIDTEAITLPLLFTVEAWMKTSSQSAYKTIISTREASVTGALLFGLNPLGSVFISTDAANAAGTKQYADGQWHHIVYIVNNSTVTIYVDNVLDSVLILSRLAPTSSLLSIGRDRIAGAFWPGNLDEIAIYNRALSASEIQSHYLAKFGITNPNSYQAKVVMSVPSNYWRLNEINGTVAKDVAGNADGTISGGVTLNGESGMTFNGTTGKITTAATIPVLATVEGWIKYSSSIGQAPFIGNFSGGGGGVYIGVNSDKACCFALSSTPGIKLLNDNQWHHIVYVLTNPGCLCYVDGVLERNNSLETRSVVTLSASIGWDVSQAAFWPGQIDEVAIYPRALSPQEILSHYQAMSTAVIIST